MEEPISTPKLPAPIFRAGPLPVNDQVFSSSPGFGTPAYPIQPRAYKPQQLFAPVPNNPDAQTVLPILLPPQTLRPVAFRTLTKKHNLTITSSGLGALATFVGKFCGSGWREEGLAERVLDEIAKQWKRDSGGPILDDDSSKKLKTLLKTLEACMCGGKIDLGRLSRTNSSIATLTRQVSLDSRPSTTREDSQTSLGLSSLEVEETGEDEESLVRHDTRSFLKVISLLQQPRFIYSATRKTFELVNSSPSLLSPVQQKITMFRNRYHLIHQRLLRNETFQTPSFASTANIPSLARSASNLATLQQAYKITPVANLLGRSGSTHLLLGILVHSAAGDLALTDLSGSIVLDISVARPVPEYGAWFCPGMVVLIEGTYEEDGSNNSSLGTAGGVGGQIKGRFVAETIAGPPAERREVTLGTGHSHKIDGASNVAGAGYGWIDFLGVGSERAVGPQMRRAQRRLLGHAREDMSDEPKRNKIIVIGECNLDNPRTLEAVRAILSTYSLSGESSERPLTIVFAGNFASAASMAASTKGGGSIEYKEQFDNLASVLSEFPSLLSSTTFVFLPGDNDPWASSFSAGAATALPRQGIPELFTSRIRRAINHANSEAGRKESEVSGEAVWATNPARMSLFGPVEEIVLFRDDISSRFRRNAIVFPKLADQDDNQAQTQTTQNSESAAAQSQQMNELMELDTDVHHAASNLPQVSAKETTQQSDDVVQNARRLVKTVLDQGHLSPFPISIRPVLWDWASSLNLYPLPTALVLADAETPAFAITYEGCHVMNPGRVLDEMGARKGLAKWIEYDIRTRRGLVRDVRF